MAALKGDIKKAQYVPREGLRSSPQRSTRGREGAEVLVMDSTKWGQKLKVMPLLTPKAFYCAGPS